MKIITTSKDMRRYSQEAHKRGKIIGFVPTMGYLHEGHLSLVRASKKECDMAIVSIFVNPTQFGLHEDFSKYPRDLERDKKMLKKEGVDALFTPSAREMYPDSFTTYVEVKGFLTKTLCARSRPTHFRGVTTVVNKLFNIVGPHKAYFGQKDAQQVVVIKKMVRDLDLPIEIRVMPIVREKDGLAMSSRNIYLSKDERKQALRIFQSLKRAQEIIKSGKLSSRHIKKEMKEILLEGKSFKIDYIEIVDFDSLKTVKTIRDNTLIAVAVFVGKVRLIDNVVV